MKQAQSTTNDSCETELIWASVATWILEIQGTLKTSLFLMSKIEMMYISLLKQKCQLPMKFLFHFFESKNYILLERRAQFDS